MKTAWVCYALLTLVVLGSWQSAEALRCEHRLVSSGDTTADVLFKCGAPTVQQQSEEELEIFETIFLRHERVRVARRILVPIEEWIYNFGPHSLMYVLRFRNGRVVDIRTRGYGY
jgi:Protein of unknown function (DUF2845)